MTRYALVTRHQDECADLQRLLEQHGCGLRPYPVMRISDVSDVEGWRTAHSLLEDWGERLWLTIASPRVPARLAQLARERGLDRLLALPIAVVGDATAAAAARAGLRIDLIGPGTGIGLARDLMSVLEPQNPLLLAGGRERRPEFAEALESAGHRVYPLVVYQMDPTPASELPPPGSDLAAVILTSPRAATLYVGALGGRPLPVPHWALGATTQQAATHLGIECRTSSRPTFESLVEELCRS